MFRTKTTPSPFDFVFELMQGLQLVNLGVGVNGKYFHQKYGQSRPTATSTPQETIFCIEDIQIVIQCTFTHIDAILWSLYEYYKILTKTPFLGIFYHASILLSQIFNLSATMCHAFIKDKHKCHDLLPSPIPPIMTYMK